MEYAVSDGTDGRKGENEDEKGIKEREPKGIMVNQWWWLLVEMNSQTEKNVEVGGERIGEEALEGRVDDEREGKWEEEDDGESKEVARVSVDDALGFGENGPEIKRRSTVRHRHGGSR